MVGRRHNRFADAVLARFAVEEGGQITVLLATCSPGGLAQGAAQPSIPFSGSVAEPLAAAFMITRTQAGPTGGMLGTFKDLHVGAEFRQQRPGRNQIHSRNRAQTRQLLHIYLWGDGLLQPLDLAFYKLQIIDQFTENQPVMVGDAPTQRQPELRLLSTQCPFGLIGQPVGMLLTS